MNGGNMEGVSGSGERFTWKEFPRWLRVLIIIQVLAVIFGLLILIIKSGRRGAGGALAGAVPAMAVGLARSHLQKDPGSRARSRNLINMAFLKDRLREGAAKKIVITPSDLMVELNGFFEKSDQQTPFFSEQAMAKVLASVGLRSEIRTIPGRSQRRWYDLSRFERIEEGRGHHGQPNA